MPHFSIKCYPKHLTKQEFKNFVEELTLLATKHLKAGVDDVSIHYSEVLPGQWKEEVYDRDVLPHLDLLAKKPGYEM